MNKKIKFEVSKDKETETLTYRNTWGDIIVIERCKGLKGILFRFQVNGGRKAFIPDGDLDTLWDLFGNLKYDNPEYD